MNWRLLLCLAFCLFFWTALYHVALAAPAVPQQAHKYRALLTREARAQWGMDAPVSTFAAQIHQESAWREDAVSPAGAQGLAQFMPATARWLPEVAPQTGEPMPFSPSWSIRAMVTYDRWLWRRISAASDCDRMAMTLSAYNGGLGWVQRDKAMATEAGLDPLRWSHVAIFNAGRSKANFKENRGYPTRILGPLTNLYRAAGWGKGACDD
ncbi:MAG: transglycosylase SLT domain-containing protein [Desulfomicrobium sp.]|nr:transglycosylase SLT domain-containing protein [Desulfomicrobium sp.]